MNRKIGIRELAERAKAEGAYDLAQGVIDTAPPKALMAALKGLELGKVSTYNNKRGVREYQEAIVNYLGSREVENELWRGSEALGLILYIMKCSVKPGTRRQCGEG